MRPVQGLLRSIAGEQCMNAQVGPEGGSSPRTMKVIFGLNEVLCDGPGNNAVYRTRACREEGVFVHPVLATDNIALRDFWDLEPEIVQFDSEVLEERIPAMVEAVNAHEDARVFTHMGGRAWGAVVPYLREDIRVVVSCHSITYTTFKFATAWPDRVSRFVAISPKVEKGLRKWLPREHHRKIRLIPNAVAAHEYRLRSPNSDGPLRIVFIGRVENYTKGVGKIPAIADRLRRRGTAFRLDIYGYFHLGYEPVFRRLLKHCDVEDVVQYRGVLTPEEVRQRLSDYDVLLMPSNYEGFGLSLLDGLSAGLAPVVSLLPGVTDWIMTDGREGFLVGRYDLDAFADRLAQLDRDRELLDRMSAAAARRARSAFSLKQLGAGYNQVFREAAEDADYQHVEPTCPLDRYRFPRRLRRDAFVDLTPFWLKRWLKRQLQWLGV